MTIRMGTKEAQLRLASAQGQYEQATDAYCKARKVQAEAYDALLKAEADLAEAEAYLPCGCLADGATCGGCGFPIDTDTE